MIPVLVFLLAISHGASCPIDPLWSEGGAIGWGELRLGMGRPEIDRLVAGPLELEPSMTSGGISHARVRLDGVSISLALRDDDGVLLGFFVVRSEGDPDACWSRATLLDRVKSVFPRASYLPSRHAPDLPEEDNRIPMYTVDPDGSVALVKPAEGMLYVGDDSVLD